MGALRGYREGRKRTASTDREQIPYILFHRFPLSSHTGALFPRTAAQLLGFLRTEVFI